MEMVLLMKLGVKVTFIMPKFKRKLGNHILSLSAMGAPQKHGQRSYKSEYCYLLDTTIAQQMSLGRFLQWRVSKSGCIAFKEAIRFNQHWGHLDRWTLASNGDTIHNRETLNTRQNYYHKPQFSLRDFWTVNDKFYVSNILYASLGTWWRDINERMQVLEC